MNVNVISLNFFGHAIMFSKQLLIIIVSRLPLTIV